MSATCHWDCSHHWTFTSHPLFFDIWWVAWCLLRGGEILFGGTNIGAEESPAAAGLPMLGPCFPILVALVLDMSRTRPGLIPTVPFFGQCPIFMRTQDRLQNVNHGSVTCPLCPATRLWVKNNQASHGPKITVTDQK